MKYCEKCQSLAGDEEFCPFCGNKRLREATENDYCFVEEIESSQKEFFQATVGEIVPCVFVPSGTGVGAQFALPLEHYKVFVPYAYYDEVTAQLIDASSEAVNQLKQSVLRNADKLFVRNEKIEKKMRKKLKLPQTADLLRAVTDKIYESDNVVDGGLILTGSVNNARYIFVYCGDVIITVNSITFEVIAVD